MPGSPPPSPAARTPSHPEGAFLVTSTGTSTLTPKQTRASRFVTPSRGVRIDTLAPDQRLTRTAAASIACADGPW